MAVAVDKRFDAVIQELDKSQGKQAYKADDLGKILRHKGIYQTPHPQGQAQTAAADPIEQRHLSPCDMDPVCTIGQACHKGICTESKY